MFNFFDKLKSTVSKTSQALVGNVVDAMDILAMKAIEKCDKKVKIVE